MGVCQLLVHGCRLPVKRLRRQGLPWRVARWLVRKKGIKPDKLCVRHGEKVWHGNSVDRRWKVVFPGDTSDSSRGIS